MDNDGSLTLALTGDSMITRRVSRSREEPVRQLIERIRGADVAFTNLEVLPTDFRGYPAQESGGDHMAAHSWVIDDLLEMGFDLFATATNHTLDYGTEGVLAMIENLDARGVCHAGVGRNLGEARMPAYFDSEAGSVALISCCSTFKTGQQAGTQRPDMQGRPGLNPIRYSTTYDVLPQQLDVLREIAIGLGVEQQRQEGLAIGFSFPPDDPAIFPFLNANFRGADEPAILRVLNERDAKEIAAWVREARSRADLVVVSMHAHEREGSKEEPAGFIPQFARRMVDEGADVVVGHGPHLLRGMEIYQGKPIFYSLGNFIAQNDLIYKMPADAYEKHRVDPTETPGAIGESRNQGDTRSFPADRRYWESIMPICRFEAGRLVEIELLPVSLRFGQPVHLRGKPRLAEGQEATDIIDLFARLSEPYGTHVEIRDGCAAVRLA